MSLHGWVLLIVAHDEHVNARLRDVKFRWHVDSVVPLQQEGQENPRHVIKDDLRVNYKVGI